MNKFFSLSRFLIGWPLSLISLIFIFKIISPDLKIISEGIASFNLTLLTYGIICFLTYFSLRSYLWKKILAVKGKDIPLREVSFLWANSEIKRFIPGKIWGIVTRYVLFNKKGIQKHVFAPAILIEIAVTIIASLILSLFSIQFIYNNFIKGILNPQVFMIFGYGSILLIIFVFVYTRVLINKLAHIPLSKFLKVFGDFPPRVNIELIIIGTVCILFFGLGTYLSISSYVLLPPQELFVFIGIFSFSVFVGFMSIVTPMGLGVREGIMTIGLSRFTTLTEAGFSSIYTRIVLIFSELIFLAIAYLWSNLKNKKYLLIEEFINKHKQEFILALLIIIYFFYFITVTFLKHDNFYTGRYDLGNMDQAVWNTIHGRIFQSNNDEGAIISRLSSHADFMLILLAPLYFVWEDPKMLLLVQTIILGLGAIFVYLIGKSILFSKNFGLAFAFAYLVNPSMQFSNLYDFHAVTLATTLLLGSFYFILKRKYLLFCIFAVFAGLTKEQVWIIVAMLGFYIAILGLFNYYQKLNYGKKQAIKQILLGSITIVAASLIFFILVWRIIPSVRGSKHFALTYYKEFGSSPTAVVKNVITSPQELIKIFYSEERVGYLRKILSPLGYTSILSPTTLVFAMPDILINSLSNNGNLHQIYFQYTATITPFLFISSIYGIKTLGKTFPRIQTSWFIIYILTAAIYSAYSFGPLPGARFPSLDVFTKPLKDRIFIKSALSKIPDSLTVAATNNLGAHLSHRQQLYTIPFGVDNADIIAFLLGDVFAQPSPDAQLEMIHTIKKNKNYNVLVEKGDFIIFTRKSLGHCCK